MTQVKQIQKEYCSQAMLLAISIALIFLMLGAKPIAKGLILGTLFSIVNFMLIAQAMVMQLNKNRGKTIMVCLGSIWVRYMLLAVPLIIAIRFAAFNFFAVATGIFMVQLVILGRHCGRMVFSMH